MLPPHAVPVDLLVTGETVAWLCPDPDCYARLPAGWDPAAATLIDLKVSRR